MRNVGTSSAVGAQVAMCLLLGCQAKADNIAYMGTSTRQFGTVDLNTGQFNLLGSTGVELAGLAALNGTLYGGSFEAGVGTLYSINPANGNLTAVGSSSVNLAEFGSTAGGLYALDPNMNLYYISPLTGAATLIGATGLSESPQGGNLSDNGGSLYLTNGANVYTVNTTTGAATLIGSTGGATFGAMVEEGGVLYGGEASPNEEVDTINTATGTATAGATVTGAATEFFGLAPDPLAAAPEPSTCALLGMGMVVCAAIFRRPKSVRK